MEYNISVVTKNIFILRSGDQYAYLSADVVWSGTARPGSSTIASVAGTRNGRGIAGIGEIGREREGSAREARGKGIR